MIGVVNTGFAYGTFVLLYTAFRHWPYMAVLIVSREISVLFAYAIYRQFVFKHRGPILREFARFWTIYLGSLLINMILLPFGVEVMRLPIMLAQALVTMFAIGCNWVGHSRYSFRAPSPDPNVASA